MESRRRPPGPLCGIALRGSAPHFPAGRASGNPGQPSAPVALANDESPPNAEARAQHSRRVCAGPVPRGARWARRGGWARRGALSPQFGAGISHCVPGRPNGACTPRAPSRRIRRCGWGPRVGAGPPDGVGCPPVATGARELRGRDAGVSDMLGTTTMYRPEPIDGLRDGAGGSEGALSTCRVASEGDGDGRRWLESGCIGPPWVACLLENVQHAAWRSAR